MKYAFAYTRYSSDNQTKNSTDTQARAIKEYAERNGYEILEHFDDAAVSGRTSERKEFMRMVAVLRSGKVRADAILVYKYSRFMRNLEESITYKRMLERLGVKVISVTEPVPEDGPVGKLIENVLACIDQFYSDVLAGLALEGQKEIVRNNYWPGGPPPFGYSLRKVENAEGHQRKGETVRRNILVINTDEAKIVRRIFEISAETGKGGHLIYKQLTDEMGGEVLGRGQRRRGPKSEKIALPRRPLGGRGVNDLLRKKIYQGVFVYNSYGFRTPANSEQKSKKERYRKEQDEWVEVKNEDSDSA